MKNELNDSLKIDFIKNADPVSYTHLDVYKRQGAHALNSCLQRLSQDAGRATSACHLHPRHYREA